MNFPNDFFHHQIFTKNDTTVKIYVYFPHYLLDQVYVPSCLGQFIFHQRLFMSSYNYSYRVRFQSHDILHFDVDDK